MNYKTIQQARALEITSGTLTMTGTGTIIIFSLR